MNQVFYSFSIFEASKQQQLTEQNIKLSNKRLLFLCHLPKYVACKASGPERTDAICTKGAEQARSTKKGLVRSKDFFTVDLK